MLRTSFHTLEMFRNASEMFAADQTNIWPNFILILTTVRKKCFLMTSQISRFVDSPKTQKSKCLENIIFLQIKKIIPCRARAGKRMPF